MIYVGGDYSPSSLDDDNYFLAFLRQAESSVVREIQVLEVQEVQEIQVQEIHVHEIQVQEIQVQEIQVQEICHG